VRDAKTQDIIVKLVNVGSAPKPLRIEFSGAKNLAPKASRTVLAGDPLAVNQFDSPKPLVPHYDSISVGQSFDYEAPPHSLSVIRVQVH
jgi:alpha-N-arabinofuranosidase